MNGFEQIVGHDKIVSHLKMAVAHNKQFHAYIFNGEDGCGKKTVARAFAAALQCEGEKDKPCGICKSCMQAASGNHPDIIWVTHEKASVGVDDIRLQVNQSIQIKPYSGPFKIYVIDDGEKMTEEAQNALLKTIEEPPAYGVIIIITNNLSRLLPTIRSRCLTLEFRGVDKVVIQEYLMEHFSVPDYLAQISATFAQGNLGKAIRYATTEDFIQKKELVLSILKNIEDMKVCEMLDAIKHIGENKTNVLDYIDLFSLWYRDVLLFKVTKDANQILFQEELTYISKEANVREYSKIEEIIEAFDKLKVRLRANVNFDIAMELMLLTLKEN